MSSLPSRKELRQKTAELVNGLKRVELLKLFGISRVADITRLDNIGLPAFNAIRCLSESIAIHSGKGLEASSSRAGAIMEAIEFEIATKPAGKFLFHRAAEIPHDDRMDLEDCFPVRSSVVNDLTPLAWEFMTNVQSGAQKLVPSDLIWLSPRIKDQPLLYFQSGTNGLASGATVEDAILSGLYEIIERDAWTLNQFLLDTHGVLPKRSPLIALPATIESCVRKIESAQVKLHLFDITNDYRVPVFSAILLDLSGNVAGTFGGYGAHLDAETAAIRAITEAAQARCCYINGSRDDLFRRQFILMKRMDQAKLDQMFEELPTTNPLSDYRSIVFPDVKSELRYLLKLIKQFGVSEVYVKELGAVLDSAIRVVRVFSPQCEPHKFDHWAPTFRCLSYCQRYMSELAEKKEPVEEGEEWKETA
jgi:ribosomal protein S12 methylthiotransferase accessory factor